jgi:toxin HigB-1
MKITFRREGLSIVRTSRAGELQLPISVIKSCQQKMVFLEAAPSERSLRNWASLHYEKLKGEREGQRSIKLNKGWRLVFELDESTTPPTIVVLEIGNHYD